MEEFTTALGLYTVFADWKADPARVLRRVKALGYEAAEGYGEPADFEPQRVRAAAEEAELPLLGWHIEWRHLRREALGGTIGWMRRAGVSCAVVPCLGGRWEVAHTRAEECRAVWEGYLEEFARIGRELSAAGLGLGYHNHEHEFALRYDGETVYRLLCKGLPGPVMMELDVGNALEGGAAPETVLTQENGRPFWLHCKPYSRAKGFDTVIGEDDVDWRRVLAACRNGGVRNLIVECEAESRAPWEAAERCLAGLKSAME